MMSKKVQVQRIRELDQKKGDELLTVLQAYRSDEMGDGGRYQDGDSKLIRESLNNHERSYVLLAYVDEEIAGALVGFENYSTFAVRHYLNVHDLAVLPSQRRKGVGRALLEHAITYSKKAGFCKVNLEVRKDNEKAMALYRSLGFKDGADPMHFWTKTF